MPTISSSEILTRNLVPSGILLPSAKNPFVIQGYFLQVSLPPTSTLHPSFNVFFRETTDFTQGAGQSALQAQYTDTDGPH